MSHKVQEKFLQLPPNTGVQFDCMEHEQWFSVLVFGEDSKPTTGKVNFGSVVQWNGKLYFPGDTSCLLSVVATDIPTKAALASNQGHGVFDYYGQPPTGVGGVWNGTDAIITVVMRFNARTFAKV